MGAVLSLASTVTSSMKIIAFILAIVLFVVYWGILYYVSGSPNFSAQSPPGTSVARQVGNLFLVLVAYTCLIVAILSIILACVLASATSGITSLGTATGFRPYGFGGGARKKGKTK